MTLDSHNSGSTQERRAAAQQYIDRGWAVLALYGVDEQGICQCWRGPRCGSNAGKHPIGAGKRGDGWMAPIASPQEIPPGANIGIKTGLASGIWALDVDPKNGGDVALAELEAEHGPLTCGWRQATGSGGQHYVFTLPQDFTPTTSPGRLPKGLDVRGEGGQIVIAPSVSGVGSYVALPGSDPGPAPAWLEDLIRPPAPREGTGPAWNMPSGQYAAQAPDERLRAYATAAVGAELERLRTAAVGARNQTAYNTACSIIELVNSPWAGVSRIEAYRAWWMAGQAIIAPDFPEHELEERWRSASHTVGVRGRPVPPRVTGGEFLSWSELGGMPSFSPIGSAHAPATAGPIEDPFSDPTGLSTDSSGTSPPVGAMSPPSGPTHLRDLLLRRSQLSVLPRPTPLIQGTLWRDTDAWLIGASGSGKSFVALDWMCHIATGREWNGRRVWPGLALYVVAEGASGIDQRVAAWEAAYEPVGDELVVLPVAVQAVSRSGRTILPSESWRQLMDIGAELRPAIITLDTQARMTAGLNENDNGEMGEFVAAVSALRRAAGGACVMPVHHTGRGGGDARGASAIDGAQDVEWKVTRAAGQMDGELHLDKNKDGPDGITHRFSMHMHELGWDPETGEPITSLSVSYDPFDTPDRQRRGGLDEGITAAQGEILDVMRAFIVPSGDTKPAIHAAVNEVRRKSGRAPLARATFYAAIDHIGGKDSDGRTRPDGLVQKGLVVQIGSSKYADAEKYEKYNEGYTSDEKG